jgi:galactonate dehydratase
MKIEAVDAIATGFVPRGANLVVRITTDTGITGLGQTGGWGYPLAVAEVVQALRSVLIGEDPDNIERLWHVMYRVRAFRGNLLSAAVAALDNALWDIKGKHLGVPVWQLLGGAARDRIRLHALLKGETPDDIARAVRGAADAGFTAVKFDPIRPGFADLTMPQLIRSAMEMAQAARDEVGEDVDLIFDLHRKFDAHQAPVVCNELAKTGPLYIEDPMQIDSIKAQAQVCGRIGAPVAFGERLSSIWEFSDLLSYDQPVVVRPDLGLSGGISQVRKIAAIAEAQHCGVSPHNFLGPGITAPTAHLCASIPNLITMEYLPYDEDPLAGAIQTTLRRVGGYLELPQAPGLGIELNPDHADLVAAVHHPLTSQELLRADGSVMFAG